MVNDTDNIDSQSIDFLYHLNITKITKHFVLKGIGNRSSGPSAFHKILCASFDTTRHKRSSGLDYI